MARKSAMIVNREALHELDLAMAQGLESLARRVLETADVPDATEGYGYIGGERFERQPDEGLVDRGGYVAYVDGKKVNEFSLMLGEKVKKPKGARVRGEGVVVIVGFGFPARFNETGTVDQPARPFFSPALMRVVGDRGLVEQAMVAALRGHLSKTARRLERTHNTAPGELLGRFR